MTLPEVIADAGRAMDYRRLSTAELDRALDALLASPVAADEKVDWMQRIVHELQVHRCELELQNRALRQTQEELEASVHRYSDLYDSLPIGYVTLTHSGQIVEANEGAADMLRVPREQLAGKFLRQFLTEKDTAPYAAHLAAAVEDFRQHVVEVMLQPAHRPAFAVQLCSRRARAGAEQVLIRTALTDISGLKETQAVLQNVIAEQESFVYSISHDLRAPLVTIQQFSSLLNDGSISGGEPTRDVIERIRRAAARMDALLQMLLEYSRVARAEAPVEPVALAAVVDDVLVEYQGLLQERHAEVQMQENLPVARASRCLLGQIVGNLLTNAIKYTPKGRSPIVKITARETDHTVILCVADEGIGIAPQHHERIFRLFERLHGPSTYPGTGIGLALVRRAAEKMHGRVWVESELGKGSRFFVELPRPAR